MKLAGIFQDIEDLCDFKTISYDGHFVFQNEAKLLYRQVYIAINILCKFGEDILINEWTDAQMHGRKVFYNLPTTATCRR